MEISKSSVDDQNIVNNWLQDVKGYDSEGNDSYIDSLQDNVLVQSDIQSEISDDDNNDLCEPIITSDIITGKNGHKWSKKPDPPTCTKKQNILTPISGPKNNATQTPTPIDAWKCLFTDDMLYKIVQHTNEEIDTQKAGYNEDCRYVEKTDYIEICAFLGLLYLCGSNKDGHFRTSKMWSKRGSPDYRATMSEVRFIFLSTCLRFDDRNNRDRNNQFSPIREIWSCFLSNCRDLYTPGLHCTIDDQLIGFRGKCPFRVCIASKPDKCGMKVVTLCDSRTYYMIDAIPYIGKENIPLTKPLPTYHVETVTKTIHGTGRNITMNNKFTSLPLANLMLNKYNLTIVGPLRKNKPEIPHSFLPNKRKEVHSSQYVFEGKKVLLSFTPRKSKSVILLSTFHSSSEINDYSKKPAIIDFYNSTKGAVETFDQMRSVYSVSRRTRRWPMKFFYAVLDQAAINAMIIYMTNNTKSVSYERLDFLDELGRTLTKPHQERRLSKNIPRSLKATISDVLDLPHEEIEEQPPTKLMKPQRCYICPRSKDRKTKTSCIKCKKPTCQNHKVEICVNCSK